MIRAVKLLIWLYLVLLVFEGALRKWVFPGYAEPLLIVRDPVVIAIYALAIIAGVFPRNAFMVALAGFIGLSVVFAMLAGQDNFFVTAYGLRTNYLHVPLIWVMAAVLDRRDVERLGVAVLGMSILMSLLMVEQFRAPAGAWINKGVGGDDSQLHGAMGRIRPPGFFSFITGPMAFFPLAAAFFLQFIANPAGGRLRWWFVLACGVAIAVAMPASISRGTVINTGLVAVAFGACALLAGMRSRGMMRFAFASGILFVVLSFLPVFDEARDVFMDRWDTAASQAHGDPWGDLTKRVTSVVTEPLLTADRAPFFGRGIGVGSNVGARLLVGRVGFLLAENEWQRCIHELGPPLGIGFILFRCVIAGYLFTLAWRALRRGRDVLPMLLWTAAAPIIVVQQWAPPTILGFAVFGGGLVMASLNHAGPAARPAPFSRGDNDNNNKTGAPTTTSSNELERSRRRMRGLA